MRYIVSIFFMLSNSLAKLPELQTKQSIKNIRYITQDYTYYQLGSGTLSLAKNYKHKPLLQKTPHTFYQITAGPSHKRLIISADESFHSLFSFSKPLSLYLTEIGSDKVSALPSGRYPSLHLNDNYYSTYDLNSKKIRFQSIDQKNIFEVKIQNKLNPYFVPARFMLTEKEVIYNDLNPQGHGGVLLHNKEKRKSKLIFKTNTPHQAIEFCYQNKNLFILSHSYNTRRSSTSLYQLNINKKGARKLLYSSHLSDIGQLTCMNSKLFFIKTTKYSSKFALKQTELVYYDLKTKNIIPLKTQMNPTQILRMNNMLLVRQESKLYLVQGNNQVLIDDALETKEKK